MHIQAEANLAALIESTEDHIWSVDLNYRLTLFNRAFQRHIEKVYGVRAAVGMHLRDLFLSERLELWLQFLRRALSEGPFRLEYVMLDGRTLYLAINPVVVDGRTTGVSVFGEDITERKRAEESSRLFTAMVESSEDAIIAYTPAGAILSWNHGAETIFGYTSDEAIGMSLAMLAVPERRAELNHYSQQLLHGDARSQRQGVGLRKDGRRIRVSVTSWPIRSPGGEVTAISCIVRDVSLRHEAEEARALLASIVESSDDAVHAVDLDGTITSWNLGTQRLFGYASEEILHKNVAVLAGPDREEQVRQNLKRVREGFTVGSFDALLQRKDGSRVEASMTISPIRNPAGEVVSAAVIARDITQRRQFERQLAESEARFRTFFEENGSVMLLADPSSGEIVAANRAASAFYGYPQDQLVGMYTSQIRIPQPGELALARQKVLRKEQSVFAYRNRLASGEERDVEIYSSPFAVNGSTMLFAIVHDVTERLRAEAQLRDSEERFRSTFEQAAIGIVHASFAGRILRCNEHFANQLGYSAEELSGMTIAQLTFPEDLAATGEVLQRIRDGSAASQSLEKRYFRKDGSVTWGKLTISLQRDGEGRAIHFVALAEDINARKTAEDRLAETREALRISEERHRAAFQTSANAVNIFRLDDGVILEANRVFLDSLGFEQSEVVGRTLQQIGIWADPQEMRSVAEELLRVGVFRGSLRMKKKNGEVFWSRLSASVFEQAGVRCALSVTQDISQAKIAEEQLAVAAEALRASEERYRTIFQTSPDAVIITRQSDGAILEVNQSFLDSARFERNEVIGRSTAELGIWVNESDRQMFIDQLEKQGKCRDLEVQSRKKDGEIFWMKLSASQIEIGGEHCRITFAKEISEVKAAEERMAAAAEALRASEERYRTIFHTSVDCITISRLSDGGYIDVNKAFLDLIGIEREEIFGRTSADLGIWAHPETRSEIVELLRRDASVRDFQTQFIKKSGELVWVLISASVIEIEGVSCLVSIVRDISGAKEAESTIQSLAFYDSLTGLPNRRMLLERLGQTLSASARSGRLKALLLVDLDNFKRLNDTLGHRIGDLLLQEAARRIAACAREADTVGRLGGDEFVVILEDLSEVAEEAATQAKAAGEKILTLIGQPFLLEGRECLSAAGIGITIFGDRQNSADDILQKADIALHLAKADGRNTVRFFSPALQTAVNARAAIEEDLRRAIKTEQFLLYYQPQVNRGRMTGVEALIRWKHPKRGIVPPDEFIPLAEESRLILPLGDWVLEAACKQIVSWAGRSETAHLTVSVNISALQFRQPEFVEHVLAALDRTGANPKNLKLELTESMLVDDFEEVIAKMTELKSHGLGFSLDDFGTGYSSLAYLKRLPLDQLKIDRSFVRDMLVDLTSGAIAQTIISLGRAMDMSVMAEGVETEEQRGFLAGLGCHSFQGYLFSRPLPLQQLEAFLEESS